MGLCLLRSLCQKQQQQCRQAIITRSIYNYYSPLSSPYNPIYQSSSIIPNFHMHTLSRIANPNPTFNRHNISKPLWSYDYEAAHNCFRITLFSNSIRDGICIDDQEVLDTINDVIYHCCRVNQVNYGFSMLAAIIKLGLVADRYTYCPLLIGLLFQNRFSEAISMFDTLIIHRKIEPDMLSYETIIQVCFDMGYALDIFCFSKFLAYAKKVMEYYCCNRQQQQQLMKDLDHISYNEVAMSHFVANHIAVNNFCKDKWFDAALSLVSGMERNHSFVGIEVYNTVIRHMVYAGEIDQAMNIFNRLWDKNLKPNATTAANIILGLSYKGSWDEALNLLRDVYSSDLSHDFKMACDNFFQMRLPPYLQILPYIPQ